VDDKKDNEEGRAPLEYLPRGPRVSGYATGHRVATVAATGATWCQLAWNPWAVSANRLHMSASL